MEMSEIILKLLKKLFEITTLVTTYILLLLYCMENILAVFLKATITFS